MTDFKTILPKLPVGRLVLEDGRCFSGVSVGVEGIQTGEVVFNTTQIGVQEVLTSPSNAGLIVAMTSPQVGNVGICADDHEFIARPSLQGVLMREFSLRPSNWRSTESLSDFFQQYKIVALSEIDTRALTVHLRTQGSQRAVIAAGDWNVEELVKKTKESPKIEEMDLVQQCSVPKMMDWTEKGGNATPICSKHVAVLDLGVKRSFLQSLVSLGAKVVLVPAEITAEELLKLQPDGLVLSHGPGSPDKLQRVVAEVAKLIDKVPMFGTGLGHQVLGLTLGATAFKLPFGHRGTQPVLHKTTEKVAQTSQNHGFCLVPESLPPEVEVTHVNLHDGTIEGFRHKELPIFAVDFEPENPPRETGWLLEQFLR